MRNLPCFLLGGLVLAVMVYAGWLTSDWRTMLAAAPAIVAIAGIVAGLMAAMIHFADPEHGLQPETALQTGTLRPHRERPRAPAARVAYNERKLRTILTGLPEIPEKYSRKKKRPRELAQVMESNCTGCGICVPFCPTDCIEVDAAERWTNRVLPPVRVRYDECIGCGICSRVCSVLAWDAAIMRPVEAIEREQGIVIHDSFPARNGGLGV